MAEEASTVPINMEKKAPASDSTDRTLNNDSSSDDDTIQRNISTRKTTLPIPLGSDGRLHGASDLDNYFVSVHHRVVHIDLMD